MPTIQNEHFKHRCLFKTAVGTARQDTLIYIVPHIQEACTPHCLQRGGSGEADLAFWRLSLGRFSL